MSLNFCHRNKKKKDTWTQIKSSFNLPSPNVDIIVLTSVKHSQKEKKIKIQNYCLTKMLIDSVE